MRDNAKQMPEIISILGRDGYYFAIVAIVLGEERRVFEFGVDESAKNGIKKILQMRPFEKGSGVIYRYYFSPSGRRDKEKNKVFCYIRIESENRGKQFEVELPEPLIANLMWFYKVKKIEDITQLRDVTCEYQDYMSK